MASSIGWRACRNDSYVMAELASWAQVVAIIFTGLLAVYVADRQLTAYLETFKANTQNEKVKNSIKVLDDMRQLTTFRGVSMSPMEAMVAVHEVASDQDALRRYKTAVDCREKSQPIPPEIKRSYLDTRAKIGIGVNYLLDLNELLVRKLLDDSYVMSKVQAFVPRFYEAAIGLDSAFDSQALADLYKACTGVQELMSNRLERVLHVEERD
jgi:hypothetical protein